MAKGKARLVRDSAGSKKLKNRRRKNPAPGFRSTEGDLKDNEDLKKLMNFFNRQV
jgi:hypothetical protein